jgi:hypothetical protein
MAPTRSKQASQSDDVYSTTTILKQKEHWLPTHLASKMDKLTAQV